ncbi:MAG: type II toxin-antitoxin system Phd/YefM family antitoxin [Nitrospirota bacterium]|nr:type II toxin-antitoxin system Phd/YefM family antitoxin [Nitrospirota bacterium]
MKLSEQVKPISYIKAHASEIIRNISNSRSPVVITLNGEARAVLQDITEYEKDRESMAMLKILAMGRRNVEDGNFRPAAAAFQSIRERAGKTAA